MGGLPTDGKAEPRIKSFPTDGMAEPRMKSLPTDGLAERRIKTFEAFGFEMNTVCVRSLDLGQWTRTGQPTFHP